MLQVQQWSSQKVLQVQGCKKSLDPTIPGHAGRILDANVPRGFGALRLLCGFSCWAKFCVHVVIALMNLSWMPCSNKADFISQTVQISTVLTVSSTAIQDASSHLVRIQYASMHCPVWSYSCPFKELGELWQVHDCHTPCRHLKHLAYCGTWWSSANGTS